jgi:hypothetical protein
MWLSIQGWARAALSSTSARSTEYLVHQNEVRLLLFIQGEQDHTLSGPIIAQRRAPTILKVGEGDQRRARVDRSSSELG